MNYLEQYLNGEHEKVWDELQTLGGGSSKRALQGSGSSGRCRDHAPRPKKLRETGLKVECTWVSIRYIS